MFVCLYIIIGYCFSRFFDGWLLSRHSLIGSIFFFLINLLWKIRDFLYFVLFEKKKASHFKFSSPIFTKWKKFLKWILCALVTTKDFETKKKVFFSFIHLKPANCLWKHRLPVIKMANRWLNVIIAKSPKSRKKKYEKFDQS